MDENDALPTDVERSECVEEIDPALMDFEWKRKHFEALNSQGSFDRIDKSSLKCEVEPLERSTPPEIIRSIDSATSSESMISEIQIVDTTLYESDFEVVTGEELSISKEMVVINDMNSTVNLENDDELNEDTKSLQELKNCDYDIINEESRTRVSEGNAQEKEEIPFEATQPILDELINSEKSYISSLLNGIKNYGNIFERVDVPMGLRGKKYVLLGNIEQIVEFHRDEFLPMLIRNQRNLRCLFKEFQQFIEENCFYGYVIFTMNKQRSLKICEQYKNYFKKLQHQINDKLGINSFLVQPIQRIAKYPLLLKEFLSALYENDKSVEKSTVESCCHLDKKLRNLLNITNESEVVNDVTDCHEFNIFHQGKFRKVCEFNIFDYTLKRFYRGQVFFFEKCIIYTEIKGKKVVFRGRYPCEHIGVLPQAKSFTLFYQRRKQQECDFHGDLASVEMCMEQIYFMVNASAIEERRKLKERFSRSSDHLHRRPLSLSLFRDCNRFSSNSGIGNIWVMPKPEIDSDVTTNRTTWYASS